jgi:hypothetical protein
MIVCGFLLRALAIHLEKIVFAIRRRPWLGGRLTRWQRLVLPFSTATVITYGLSCAFAGAAYLLTAPPGWNPFSVLALCFNAAGGRLLGFGAPRLLIGLFIIKFSGLWAAPRRAAERWRLHRGRLRRLCRPLRRDDATDRPRCLTISGH